MTTTNTQHKGNGDNATHYDNATIANARKYYALIDDNGREEAKRIVDDLVKRGKLQTSEFYVKSYKDEVSRRENLAQREERRKEQEEQVKRNSERAKEEANAKREEAEKKVKKEAEVDQESIYFVNAMIEKGNTIPMIKGYLQFKGYSTKVIKAFLETLDLKKAKPRAESGIQAYMNSFIAKPMSEEEFKAYINEGSDNIKRHESLYRNMFNTFNAIHARYNG